MRTIILFFIFLLFIPFCYSEKLGISPDIINKDTKQIFIINPNSKEISYLIESNLDLNISSKKGKIKANSYEIIKVNVPNKKGHITINTIGKEIIPAVQIKIKKNQTKNIIVIASFLIIISIIASILILR